MARSGGNEHAGHRSRLRSRFLKSGLDGFEPHQALELFLFYAMPRIDTNPMAHRLLNCYRTIDGVFDAPYDELRETFGLSESAAVLIKLFPEMVRLYQEEKCLKKAETDENYISEVISSKFIGRKEEAVALVLCDAKERILFSDIISNGSIASADMPIRKVLDLALRHKAKFAYIAHNHPSGNSLPSAKDISVTRTISNTLMNVGVYLLDHYIVTDTEVTSMRECGFANSIFPI